MITFNQVSKSYRTANGLKVILDDFDCDIPTDRSIGILGRNGVGKSSLVRMIVGYELPDRGWISKDLRVSFPLAHTGALTPTMSGRENVRFIARLYGEDVTRVVRFVTDFSELADYMDEPLWKYSNSMRARLAFGICIAIDFDLYVIDEITAVGDPSFKRKCIDYFAERRKRSTVLMVSTSSNTMKQYCEAGAILAGGEIRLFDHLDEAIAAYGAASDPSPEDREVDWGEIA